MIFYIEKGKLLVRVGHKAKGSPCQDSQLPMDNSPLKTTECPILRENNCENGVFLFVKVVVPGRGFMKREIFLFTLLFSTISVQVYAETMTISTYYPAPFGAYDRLKLVPRPGLDASVCNSSNYGLLYSNSDDSNHLYLCGEDGGAGKWSTVNIWKEKDGGVFLNYDYTDLIANPIPWVGLGVSVPQAPLEVNPGIVVLSGDPTVPEYPLAGKVNVLTFGNLSDPIPYYIARIRKTEPEEATVVVGGNSYLTLHNSGNTGIGTLAPQAALDVANGVIVMSGDVDFGGGVFGNSLAFGNLSDDYYMARTNKGDPSLESIVIRTGPASPGVFFHKGGDIGLGIANPEFNLHLNQDGGILAKGIFGSGKTLTTNGIGTRLIWYPKKAAFRAGYVDIENRSTYWDDANIGNYSLGIGKGVKASGDGSVALGVGNVSSGTGAVTMGINNQAIGDKSVALGDANVSGDAAQLDRGWQFTVGLGNTASDNFAVAIGQNNQATNTYAFALGGNSIASGSRAIAWGQNTEATADRAIAIGDHTKATGLWSTAWGQGIEASGEFSYGISLAWTAPGTNVVSQANTMAIMGGSVGINMVNPSYPLDVNGNIRATNVSVPSDIRFKEKISVITDPLENISKIRGVTYYWKDSAKGTDKQMGVIAQEVEKVFPEVVSEDQDGYKSVSYEKLVAVLIEAVKELKLENDELKAANAELRATDEALKIRFDRLEQSR